MATAEQSSSDELRELACLHATRGAVVSLFLAIDPEGPSMGPEIASRLDALVAAGRREARAAVAELDRAGRIALETDLREAADQAVRNLVPPGVGCFVDSLDGLWRTVFAPAPLADAVRVGPSAYLVPLAVGRSEPAVVAVVSRERGEIFSLEHGELAKRVDLSEEQPRRHRDAEAWQQRKLERPIDTLAHQHLQRIAAQLDRVVISSPDVRAVLVGEVEHTAALTELLCVRGRAALAGAVRAEAHADAAELLPLVRPVLKQSSLEHDRRLVARWRSGLGGAGLGVQGWPGTLYAASAGRIELLLFINNAVLETAGVCPVCGLAVHEGTRCPIDGAALEAQPDALDLAVRLALRHGGHVRRVAGETGFDALDGVGALLRFRG
jgi:hypothetical protein